MAVNTDIIANDLFKTIKGFNLNVQLFNEDGKRVIDPGEARKFYATDKKFMVTYESDEDPQSIKLYFGKNFTLDETSDFNYNKFIKQVRNLAQRKNAISFTVKNYGKEIQPKDFAYQSINRNADMGNIAEGLSPAYGSSKSSYQKLDNAKLVIRHNKPVDEGIRGSRARNITALFVENGAGERFKYPYNHLAAARAMTRHVAEGGTPYDNIGGYITKLSEELATYKYSGIFLFSGFVEPMVDKNIYNLISIVRKNLPKAKIEMVTNGDALNQQRVKKLFDSGLVTLLVSIYDGKKEADNMEELLKDSGLDGEQYKVRHRYLPESESFGITLTNRSGMMDNAEYRIPSLKEALKRNCHYPHYSFFMDYTGEVLICSHDWGKKLVIGNLKNDSFINLWLDQKFMQARKKLLNSDRNFDPCNKCDVNGVFMGKSHANEWKKIL